LINFVDRSQRANHYARPPASMALCTSANGMNHTCLCLPSYNKLNFSKCGLLLKYLQNDNVMSVCP